jgi:hypothetical protein
MQVMDEQMKQIIPGLLRLLVSLSVLKAIKPNGLPSIQGPAG